MQGYAICTGEVTVFWWYVHSLKSVRSNMLSTSICSAPQESQKSQIHPVLSYPGDKDNIH